MPLSYDWTAMKNLVDSLYPAGNTNQGIGIAHGWHVAGRRRPLSGAPPRGSEVQVHQGHHPDERRLEHREPLVHQPELRSMRARR